ncbi:uncharacterized protein SPAPADRAFT_59612 [Spathaspora passalidarum NRRL Y-27907]|uniref:Uncharacterized protein n=1 Tax=Spathaspora passalidarum (strain NRRL Y-27907 / 11-Y1) TaxID=619300 RepID=G3AHL5_SPAPN|nr:uncharacterized protein SPAPADRAFT_59612 [Spathaspora passalidarum NRRL Y-27907]EGW34179.1 hypothetical protein SPAPADRAFT_59612 [Spathaspora passalidarum NRRL Y-27907]
MSTTTSYPKRKLELIPFNNQIEYIDKVIVNNSKHQNQFSNYGSRYNHGHGGHGHNHHNQQQNKYALAAVAVAAAVQHQQQQHYLLQQQQQVRQGQQQKQGYYSGGYQQQQQQQQYNPPQYQKQPSQTSSPQMYGLQQQPQPQQYQPPQIFADVGPSVLPEANNSFTQGQQTTGGSSSQAPGYDLKTNFMIYNNSSNSISSPTSQQPQLKQSSVSSASSATATLPGGPLLPKLFDSIGTNSTNNSPILLPPNANTYKNSSPPDLFLSNTTGNSTSTLNNSPPLVNTPTPTTNFFSSPSLLPGSSSNWNTSNPSTSSIWGQSSNSFKSNITLANPTTSTTATGNGKNNLLSSFGSTNLW